MSEHRLGGRVVRLIAILGAAIVVAGLVTITALAKTDARVKSHAVRHHASLNSVGYLKTKADALGRLTRSTRRAVKHGPTGPRGPKGALSAAGARALAKQQAAESGARSVTVHPLITCAVPDAPGAPSATRGANQAAVTWTAPNPNGATITGYLVTAVKGTISENAQDEPASATTATLTGIASGSYKFTIIAQSSCGNSAAATTTAGAVTGTATTYASTAIADGPAAYFRLGEPAGTAMAADSSGHGLVGTYNTGGITLGSTGALPSDTGPNGAFSINDTSGSFVATVPSPAGLPVGNDARTVQAWVKPNDGNCRWVMGFGANNNDQSYNLGECANAVLVSAFNDDLSFTTPEPVNDGAWHLITVTYDGTNVIAYLDGRSLGTKTFSDPLSTAASGLSLGAWDNQCCNSWTFGGLQDEAVYAKALTATQVTALFNASGYGVPTAPGSPAATGAANKATIHWTAATANGTSLTGYIVTAKLGATLEQSIAAPPGATTATITGLPAGTYTFTITGRDVYGNGAVATTASTTVTGTATTYASTVLADHPSVFYRLDEPTGSLLAADSSGKGVIANYANSCLTLGVAGPLFTDVATGATSSACNNIASASYSAKLPSGTASRTLQAWVKPSDSNCRYFMGYGATYTDGEFSIGTCGNAVLVTLQGDDHSFFSPRNIADGSWHLVTVTDTYSATTGNSITAYLDGQKLGTQATNTPNTAANTGIAVGSYPNSCCYFGGVANAAVYPTALTAAQITAQLTASGDTVPTAPGSVTATASANLATVSWTKATATGATVTGYVVTEYAAGKPQQSVAVAGTTLSAKITGLPAGSYTFGVVAYDTYGAGPSKNSTPATTISGASTTYSSTVLASKPALYYRLNEPIGASIMADSSGNGVLGAYQASNVTHGVAGALVETSNTAATQTGGPFLGEAGGSTLIPAGDTNRTVEAWIKPNDGFCQRYVLGFGANSTDQGFTIGECPNQISVDADGDARYFSLPHSLDDGNWHFLAATYNDTNGVDQVTAYMDGVSLGTRSFAGTLATPAHSTLWIGAGPADCCTAFFGSIDEVAVFPTALTGATVAAQFAASGHAVPAAPTAVTATVGANQLTVKWTAPVATSGNAITGYVVSAYAGTTLKASVGASPTGTHQVTLSGLPGGTAYTVKVVAYDSYGAGPAGASAAATPTGGATTYSSTLLADSPLAYYRLSEGSGSPFAADSSGGGMIANYNASGTTFGTSAPIPGDPATSVTQNGSNPVASDATTPNKLPVANRARSYVAWVKPVDNTCRYVMGYGNQSTDQGFGLVTCPNDSSNGNANTIDVVGWSDDHLFTTTHNLNDGNWHQVVVTYDGTNLTVYVDGVNLGTQQFNGTLNTPSSTGLYLGAGPQGAGNFFNGSLADLAVLPAALSSSQVSALFNASGYGVPSAPGGVSATAGANQATVSWSAATAPNTGVTGYVVTAMVGGTTAANAVATSGSQTSATLYGLKGGTSYTFKVVALDTYGAGAAGTASAVSPTGSAITFAAAVLADTPSAYYRLGETSGSLAADSSGNGILADYNSATTLGAQGALGAAPHADPSTSITDNSGYAAFVPSGTSNALPSGNSARSVAAWIKPSDSQCRYFASYGTTQTAQGFGVGECGTTVTVSGFSDDLSFSTGSVNLADGNWHYVVVTYDGAGNVNVYVDGTLLASSPQALAQQLNTPANTGLIVGDGIGFGSNAFSGGLQDVAVFPTQLSSSQVTTLYAAR